MNRPFTGRHMAMILIVFFGIVFAVNFLMARLATSTFGGIVVENTYVASQEFNGWLDQAERQRALGWTATVARDEDNRLAIQLDNAPQYTVVTAEARHPLGQAPNRHLTFSPKGDGRFLSQQALPAGRWIVRITAQSGETVWRIEENVE
ncbi:FixH family protein [Caenibius sp. WL]|uniref:FixH family protein n=1 Tax=Caenibius sp. WL TaxID=2872646 RepID=UPI001C993439|nr:FixH family protein [Caenibius sp. WL]QZP07174.1 FixH family protein [Caenibius sp. WL]